MHLKLGFYQLSNWIFTDIDYSEKNMMMQNQFKIIKENWKPF